MVQAVLEKMMSVYAAAVQWWRWRMSNVEGDCLPAATKVVAVRRNKRRNDELSVQGKEEGEVGEEQKMRLFFPMQMTMFTRRFSGTRAATHANLP